MMMDHSSCEQENKRYRVATFQKKEAGKTASRGAYRNVTKEIMAEARKRTFFWTGMVGEEQTDDGGMSRGHEARGGL